MSEPAKNFESLNPTVVVHQRTRFIGTGKIKNLEDGRRVIAGFTGIYPSRNPKDTDSLIRLLEDEIFGSSSQGVDTTEGSTVFKSAPISWKLR